VIVAFALAFLSQVMLSVLKPDLVLPRWAPTQGGFVGISLVVASRSLFPPRAKLSPDVSPISVVEIGWKAEELGKRIGYSTKAYVATSVLFSLVALYFIVTGNPKTRAASCLLLAGTLYLVHQIREKDLTAAVPTDASPNNSLDSYRRELQGQRAFLQRVSYWYYGSLVPATILSLLGYPVYLYWLPLVVLIAAELNHRAAEELRHELIELNASEALKQLPQTV
jgi:hypothetical protein